MMQPCVQVRVRTDQVQCDIFTAQYKLFNFSVNKFISGVITNNLRKNMYLNGVNPVSRVIQNTWCEWFSLVDNTLFWYEHKNMGMNKSCWCEYLFVVLIIPYGVNKNLLV